MLKYSKSTIEHSMDKRLEERHSILVKSHMNHKHHSTSGLDLLINQVEGFSQAQAAWRFYKNLSVDTEFLTNPIVKEGVAEINKRCNNYVLIPYDWSSIDYKNHTCKKDCIETKRSNITKARSRSYDLQSSIALSDVDGEPITPLMQNLKTKDSVHSTYDHNIDLNATHLDELAQRSKYTYENLGIKKKQ